MEPNVSRGIRGPEKLQDSSADRSRGNSGTGGNYIVYGEIIPSPHGTRGEREKMKLYGYYNNEGKIHQAEIEVEEKVVLVPKEGGNFPFYYGDSIDKEQLEKPLGCCQDVVFFAEESREKAKEMFVKFAEKKFLASEELFEKTRDVLERLRSEG